MIILAGLVVLGCMMMIFFMVSLNRRSKIAIQPAAESQPVITSAKEIAAMIPQATPPEITSTSGLVLNGIIASEDEQMALINNQILKAGDYIDGKRVVRISNDTVEIFDNGKVIKLTTKRY